MLRNEHHGNFQIGGGWTNNATRFSRSYEPTNTRIKILDLFGAAQKADTIAVTAPINDIIIAFTFEDAPNFVTIFNQEYLFDHKKNRLQVKQRFRASFDCSTNAETKIPKKTGVELSAGTSGSQCTRPNNPVHTNENMPSVLPIPDLKRQKSSSRAESRQTDMTDTNADTQADTQADTKTETDLREIKFRKDYISFKDRYGVKRRIQISTKPKDMKKWVPKEPQERAKLLPTVLLEAFDIFDYLDNHESYYFVPIEDFMTAKQMNIIKAHWSSINNKDHLPTPIGYVLMDTSNRITPFTGIFLIIRSYIKKYFKV